MPSSATVPLAQPAAVALEQLEPRQLMSVTYSKDFSNTLLESTAAHVAKFRQPNLQDPHGLTLFLGVDLVTADIRNDSSLAYNQDGMAAGTTTPFDQSFPDQPTACTDASSMLIEAPAEGGGTTPVSVVYVTSGGRIYGLAGANNIQLLADDSSSNAGFDGAAVIDNNLQPLLAVTDSRNKTIDVYNNTMQLQSGYAFTDPTLPAGWVPTNIAYLNYQVEVVYQKVGSDGKPLSAKGSGLVDTFTAAGAFLRRISVGLYQPYGLAFGAKGYGEFDNDLLISDHYTGAIYAYTFSGKYVGSVRNSSGSVVNIPGIWSITANDPTSTGVAGALFYSATPGATNTGEIGVLLLLSGKKYGQIG